MRGVRPSPQVSWRDSFLYLHKNRKIVVLRRQGIVNSADYPTTVLQEVLYYHRFPRLHRSFTYSWLYKLLRQNFASLTNTYENTSTVQIFAAIGMQYTVLLPDSFLTACYFRIQPPA